MEKRDFLYLYTDIFFSEAVKETILIESWKEKDFDHRYVEYARVFLKTRDKCFAKDVSGEWVQEYLTKRKNHVVGLFNQQMEKDFIKELMKYGYDETNAKELIPDGIFCEGQIKVDALKTFRDLEEVICRKQGAV